MGKIIQLSDAIANMIAAGEVVENMASVVKELVENALDAESTSVEIHLLEAGLKEIRIIDNGTGMEPDDLSMAFKRHATSKIRTQHDLYHIASLGFRGEALPAIAGVSELIIESSTGNETGRKLIIKSGQILEETLSSIRKGTIVTVKRLFYNTPARLKHLRSEQRELASVVEIVQKLALAHHGVRFLLTHNHKTLLNTNGEEDTLKILHQIYDVDVAKNMLAFTNKNAYFKIQGYLCKPIITRTTRKHISMVTNHRLIKNQKIVQAIVEGYKSYLPIQKYPIVHLEINVDPLLIDVNIHPQKLEVKFTEEAALLTLIRTTVHDRLKQENLIPDVRKTPEKQSVDSKIDFKHPYDSDDSSLSREASDPMRVQEEQPSAPNSDKVPTPKKLPDFDYIGQALGTYLIFQDDEGCYLIDQHAAAERIRYEQYRDNMGRETTATRALLIPLDLHLSKDESLALTTLANRLSDLGVTLENQGIIAVPTWFPEGEEETYTEIMIHHLLDDTPIDKTKMIDRLAIDLACKHSIKANRHLSKGEIDRLVEDLDKTENPYTCPHGRPTLIRLSQTELERLFKRIQS